MFKLKMNRYARLSTVTCVLVGATTLLSIALHRWLGRKQRFLTLTSMITDPTSPGFWKAGDTMVLNPWHFRTTSENVEEEQQQVTSLLQKVYAAPPEQQEALALQIALENEDKAQFLWYQAHLTGHEVIATAIVNGGKFALQGGDVGQTMERSFQSHLATTKEKIWQADEHEQRLLLVEKFCEENPSSRSQLLFDAAVEGHPRVIEMLINMDVAVHPPEEPDLLSLHAACFQGNLECAKVLHSSGVAIDYLDENGNSPLMRAACAGHTEIVEWLLDNHADINLQGSSAGIGVNALVFAVWQGHEDVIQVLMQRGSTFTSSIVSAAAMSDNIDIFEKVLDFCDFPRPLSTTGQDVQLSSSQRSMLVDALAWCGDNTSAAIIRKIVNFIIPLRSGHAAEGDSETAQVRDRFLQSLLQTAKNDKVEVVDFMLNVTQDHLVGDLDGQLSPSVFGNQVNQLLSLCADFGSVNIAKYLIEKQKAHVNSRRLPHHSSVLYHAAAAGHINLVESLITVHEADIHQGSGKFANGPTALWKAVESKQEWVVRKLLELGGPVEAVTDEVNSSCTHVFVVTSKTYRAPVMLTTLPQSSWFEKGSSVRFLCLQYPEGLPFLPNLQFRKSDDGLKDERDLRLPD